MNYDQISWNIKTELMFREKHDFRPKCVLRSTSSANQIKLSFERSELL